ncbi:MAG: S-methyl-5'-thioinosine phosphorylase [Gammaproteobacteria bacterium]
MTELAIIGGTGLTRLHGFTIERREVMHTPYGEPSGALTFGEMCGKPVVFLPRHGYGHTIPPHMVNYQANLWALKKQGVQRVLAVCAVGAIRSDLRPSSIVIPDQIIDYTWSRSHTFFEADLSEVTHIDFTEPYCPEMRAQLLDAATKAGIEVFAAGTYGASQGPRLETAAEIDRMERDGCHMVGMTGMPEAALARELDLCYGVLAVSANAAAGRGDGAISMQAIEQNLVVGMEQVRAIIEQFVTTGG